MSKRTKYTTEEKYKILDAYENGYVTMQKTLTKYSISKYDFYDWKYKYSKYGIDGLKESRTCKKYSNELKELAVNDYMSGKFSQSEVVKKYELTDRSVLRKWINKYNGHREIKSVTKGMSKSMTKGRVTSWKERMKLHCTVLLKATTINKLEEELTPEDRTKISMKILEEQNEKLRAENAFLKKLEELERGRY